MELIFSLLIVFWLVRLFFRAILFIVTWLYDSILGGFSPATERRIRYVMSQIVRWVRFAIAIVIIVCLADMLF